MNKIKIAIFSDIHSNYLVFKKAYEDALSKKVDMFLFLGDYVTLNNYTHTDLKQEKRVTRTLSFLRLF